MADCLEPSQLEALIAGTLLSDAKLRAEEHVRACEACRRRLDAGLSDHRLVNDINQAFDGETQTVGARGSDNQEPVAPPLAETIEGYQILSEIHRGGQGVVYKAVQKATKRTIALKVLLHGPYASSRQRQRFEREIDLVASLQHPSIITIFDSGVTKDRHHYFAMEYVHGQSLDEYAKAQNLSLADRLRLVQKICEAVGHAHLRGVIHRDLKPSNIRIDAMGKPHVLDFGLAKTAGPGLMPEGAPVTMTGEFMGTLAYASPEQTCGDPNVVDVRTDVYSLGVILYELLTNCLPYSTEGRLDDGIRAINEAEPKRPSLISSKIDNEVETIVLKALAKEPDRRYHNATALAEDIGRYLRGEAIDAKRASSMYLLKKTMRRHRGLIAGGVIVMVVVSFLAGTAWRFVRQWRAEAQAKNFVAEAALCIQRRADFPKARGLINQAVGLDPALPGAYLFRGNLAELEGLNAPLERKDELAQAALENYEKAHTLAGGFWLSDVASVAGHNGSLKQDGLKGAVRRAAYLRMLQGRHPDARNLLELARNVGGGRAEIDEASIYDPDRDPLIGEPGGQSPEDARVGADDGAEIRRCLRVMPRSMYPLSAATYEDLVVTELLFDPLVYTDAHSHYQINKTLVASISPLNTKLVSEMAINPNARWHDGTAVTAEDIVFSWNELADDHESKKSLLDVRAVDPSQVAFHHAAPVADAAWDLLFPVVPKHVLEGLRQTNPGQRDATLFSKHPIGNGPFRFVMSDEDRIVLQRWDEYSGRRPYVKRVVFRVIADRKERVQALAKGDVHEMELTPGEFVWDVNGASFENKILKTRDDRWGYDYICWNNDEALCPFFHDKGVRRAMTLAFDPVEIARGVYGIPYGRSTGIYYPGSWMASPRITPIGHDPAKAVALLEQAGWHLAPDGVRQKNGLAFEFTLLVAEESRDTRLLLTDLTSNLEAVGVRMKIQVLPDSEVRSRFKAGTFDAFVYSVIDAGHPDAARRRWITDGEANYARFSDRQVDKLFRLAREEHDQSVARGYYADIQERIYEAQPYTFLWHRPALWALHKNLRGVESGRLGLTLSYPGARNWWFPRGSE